MNKAEFIQQARTANRFVLRAVRESLPRVAELYREDRRAAIMAARIA